MSNQHINDMRDHIIDTLMHRQYFTQACIKMIDYLYNNDRSDEALMLAKRCMVHDNSKLESDEIICFVQLLTSMQKRDRFKKALTKEQKQYLEAHWKRNPHHPEYFNDYHEMSEIDVMEMCCDWYARNMQIKGMPLIEYAITVQKQRFNFDANMMRKVLFYCRVLLKDSSYQ